MGGLTRRTLLAGGSAAVSLAAPSLQATAAQATTTQPARSSAAFIASIGVDIHLNTPAYIEQYDTVVQRLRELGLKHVREGFGIGDDGIARLNALAHAAGIRATLISSPTANTPEFARDALLHRFGSDVAEAVEGINEPDGWFRAQPAAHGDWVAATVQHQRDLYRAIKSTPSLAHLLVLGPAIIDVDSVDLLAGTLPFCDVLNMHPYPGAWNPETAGWGGAMRGFGYGSLDWAEANTMPRLRPGMPVMATETGYHNAVRSKSPQPGVPEWVSGIYVPRLFLYYFRKSVARTFIYELLDEGTDNENLEASFGLLRHDGTRKPAFTALRNLIAVLADPGPDHPADGLDMAVTTSGDAIETVLLQKRDGTFYLAAWKASQIWDPATRAAQATTPAVTRLSLGREMKEIAVAKPNDGIGWRTLATAARSAELTIDEKVAIVRLQPQSDAASD